MDAKTLILLSCGHWTDGGSDPAWWIREQSAKHDVGCQRCPDGTESVVVKVLSNTMESPLWLHEGRWL